MSRRETAFMFRIRNADLFSGVRGFRFKPFQRALPVIVLAVSGSGSLAGGATSWRRALEGRWTGSAATWTFDQDSVQVNRDPGKPFQWEFLRILTTQGQMIVFDIGSERYVGLFDGATLTLSRSGHPGFITLTRERR
jgi:hypothetical protein